METSGEQYRRVNIFLYGNNQTCSVPRIVRRFLPLCYSFSDELSGFQLSIKFKCLHTHAKILNLFTHRMLQMAMTLQKWNGANKTTRHLKARLNLLFYGSCQIHQVRSESMRDTAFKKLAKIVSGLG
jgi:hypothetical protein